MIERKSDKSRCISPMRRRLTAGLCAGLFVSALGGCGGSATEEAAADAWDIPTNTIRLSPGASYNLAATLPGDVRPGGVFEVDPSGAPLPTGITLFPNGLLSVGPVASGSSAGVIFRYTPPA